MIIVSENPFSGKTYFYTFGSSHYAAAAASEDPAVPPVWSMDCSDRLVVVGCATGRIEVWEARTGAFR